MIFDIVAATIELIDEPTVIDDDDDDARGLKRIDSIHRDQLRSSLQLDNEVRIVHVRVVGCFV
jgi:hypothetical protein